MVVLEESEPFEQPDSQLNFDIRSQSHHRPVKIPKNIKESISEANDSDEDSDMDEFCPVRPVARHQPNTEVVSFSKQSNVFELASYLKSVHNRNIQMTSYDFSKLEQMVLQILTPK